MDDTTLEDIIDALQVRPRCKDALRVFRAGEDHLAPKVLHERMSALEDGWGFLYGTWSLETFMKALDPSGRGVRPGRHGYSRHAVAARLAQLENQRETT